MRVTVGVTLTCGINPARIAERIRRGCTPVRWAASSTVRRDVGGSEGVAGMGLGGDFGRTGLSICRLFVLFLFRFQDQFPDQTGAVRSLVLNAGAFSGKFVREIGQLLF